GMAHQPFNTIFQLAAERREGLLALPPGAGTPEGADAPTADPSSSATDAARGRRALLLPDLLGSWLTGAAVSEITNASTTALLDQQTREWSADLLGRLDLPAGLFPPLVEPGHVLGPLADEVQQRTGLGPVPVIAVGSHDTASAVAGIPATI